MEPEVILGQVSEFESQQAGRCAALGINISTYSLSHVAVRCRTWQGYLRTRDALESRSVANHENARNGKPISKIVLSRPLPVAGGKSVSLIELIAPFHQRVYRMGLEHVGYVVGEEWDGFADKHCAVLTGQQFQSEHCRPLYILFPDYTHVKFYEFSLRRACELEGARFDGFRHADWSSAALPPPSAATHSGHPRPSTTPCRLRRSRRGSATRPDRCRPMPSAPTWPGCAASNHRLLGNGHCTRPADLNFDFESICENCSFFQTSKEFCPHSRTSTTTPRRRANTIAPTSSANFSPDSRKAKHHE